MDKVMLRKLLDAYLLNFDKVNRPEGMGAPNEWYKWNAVSCFKEHWNPDVTTTEFPEMFNAATDDLRIGSLLSYSWGSDMSFKKATLGKFYKRGITFLFQNGETEFVRRCFETLYANDGGDLEKREINLAAFRDGINGKIKEYSKNENWELMQDDYSASCFLNLLKPENNYFYKPESCQLFAKLFKFENVSRTKKKEEFSLHRYYEMCDALRVELKKDEYEDVRKKNQPRVDKYATNFDDDLHILTYDIIHCTYGYKLYEKIKW